METKKQLPLEFFEEIPPTLDNFIVPGDGSELFSDDGNKAVVAALKEIKEGAGPQFVYIWGDAGAGKSHLIRAMAPQKDRVPAFTEGIRVYAVDDVQSLSPEQLHRLFDLFNEIRAHAGTHLITAGDRSPKSFEKDGLRKDLTSRLSWGQVYELAPLPEENRHQIILDRARARGIALTPEVVSWMENNLPRDMGSLSRLLNDLDRYAMASKRAVTIPLIKECLQAIHKED